MNPQTARTPQTDRQVEPFRVIDLFAGAGGCSTGARAAADAAGRPMQLVAVNHWPRAIETHTKNHPDALHFCAPVDAIDPRVAVPGGHADLLIAAPECTHHSTARGGRPINDQSRASAWHIMRWLELLTIDAVLIENVPEFESWGPIGANGRPMPSRKGAIFDQFIGALRAYGYRVEYKVLNAADYGDATTRRRLFIQARRHHKRVTWPIPTHAPKADSATWGRHQRRAKWRAAREIIDWTLPSQSIFTRKKPLQPATMRRIIAGLEKFGGPQLAPFLVILRQNMGGRSVDDPLPTLTSAGTHVGLAQPFMIPFYGERDTQDPRTHSVDEPVPVIPTDAKFGVVEPFVMHTTHGSDQSDRARSVSQPLPTITTANRGEMGLIEPFIITPGGPDLRGGRTVSDPLPTVCGGDRFAVVQPYLLGQQTGSVARPVSEPVPTLSTDGAVALVEAAIAPFTVPPRGFNQDETLADSVDTPLRTVTAAGGGTYGLAQPFLTRYYGSGSGLQPASIEKPLDTVTVKARFGLCQPVVNGMALDIRFRMLQPHELAGAMSFPPSYVFTGNKGEQIKQVGNAVACGVARALVSEIIRSL